LSLTSVIATRRHPSPALVGIGLTLLATLLFTIMDTIGKSLTATYPVPLVVWARYFFQFALLLLLIPRIGVMGLVRTRRPFLHLGRGLLLAGATFFFITAISVVPLANAYTITFSAPLLVTVLSIPLLREQVGWRRWSAVLVGFVGVLIALGPFSGEVQWAMLLPLVTATCFAFYQVLTRIGSYSAGETTWMMLFYTAMVGAVVASAVAPFYWQPIALGDLGWMVAVGAIAVSGHLSLIKAISIAPASLVAPFVYSQMVWALAIGYLWFGDVPGIWMLIGCAVIISSGLYVFYREALLGKK
jgi:drug/metabolite transporter (DMT)-like permease